MIDRERWIVYPLLLLALGASLREKFVPPQVVEAPELRASQIVLVDDRQQARIILKTVTEKTRPGTAAAPSEGRIELLGERGENHPSAVIGRVSLLPEVFAERLIVKNIVLVNERQPSPASGPGQRQKSAAEKAKGPEEKKEPAKKPDRKQKPDDPAGANNPTSTEGAAAEKAGGGSADDPPGKP